ncbi:hypothetical protein EDD11_008288 [Mortierella claussenii]|nr:hypothetical protein EDD11_008288 [Mortierella claussenii]
MVVLSLRSLILSASLATLAILSTAAPTSKPAPSHSSGGEPDACAILGSKTATQLTYSDVADCYRAIPFNPTVAATTLKTVHSIYDQYYVFRDSALTPDLKAPFSSAPVDISGQLEALSRKKYANDYSFHTDITKVIQTLHDAHAGYSVDCYNAFLFAQPLNLYAPTINDKQSIRVFKDFANRGWEDCEVLTIDGQDAMTYLTKFATTLGFSKDAGVRLNQALANQIYSHASQDFIISSGDFAERATLPDKSDVEYTLQCANHNNIITVRDSWKVLPLNQAHYTDVPSYVANVCHTTAPSPPPSNNTIHKRALEQLPHKRYLYPVPKKSVFLEELDAAAVPPTNVTEGFPGAEKLGAGNATVYYHLKDQPDVGVVVVFTHAAEPAELDVALAALDEFHKRNVSNILFDFQGNGGGSVAFASFLVQLFFPSKAELDNSLRSDLRINPSIQELSRAVFNNSDGGLYNGAQYVDLKTHSLYTTDALFLESVNLTRNGRQSEYTDSTTLAPQLLPEIKQLASFPWTNNPANFRILSDGRCGSACALSAHYFHALYNVSTYSIGGVQGQDLSVFSFAGGAVSDLGKINEAYAAGNVTSPLETLPYKSDVRLPVLEVYAANSDVPLEYDASHYAADVHVDFDPQNARSRDVMWTQVASAAWK